MDILGKELFFDALSRIRTAGERIGVHVPHQTIACCQPVDLTSPDSDAHHLGHSMGYHESRGCKVGRFMVTVLPNGDVQSCPYVPYRIGSLRTQSIREIWRAPLLQRARKHDLGCLSRSMIHAGRPDVLDPTYGRSSGELLRELAASTTEATEA
jgi:MoaA/NifB/PqqE/SkfB family radical SAM enzyme